MGEIDVERLTREWSDSLDVTDPAELLREVEKFHSIVDAMCTGDVRVMPAAQCKPRTMHYFYSYTYRYE